MKNINQIGISYLFSTIMQCSVYLGRTFVFFVRKNSYLCKFAGFLKISAFERWIELMSLYQEAAGLNHVRGEILSVPLRSGRNS